jgi:hypothetical protein
MNEWAFGLHLEQCEVNMKMNVKNPNVQDKERKKRKKKEKCESPVKGANANQLSNGRLSLDSDNA